MSHITHAPDPTKSLGAYSSVAGAYFAGTTLCRRKPAAHGLYTHPKRANVDCARCLKLLDPKRSRR